MLTENRMLTPSPLLYLSHNRGLRLQNPPPPPSSMENPNPNPDPPADEEAAAPPPRRRTRAPFTSLPQEDADLALARALQEQERAYMMLRWGGGGGDYSDYGSADQEGSDYEDEENEDGATLGDGNHNLDGADAREDESEDGSDYGEDAFDAMDRVLDPADFGSDEAYAAALQQAEERELVERVMALTGLDVRGENYVVDGNDYQDEWDGIDPDELSYEELAALGEIVGTASRGLTAGTIASLPSVTYKAGSVESGNTDQCVICRLDYENGESLIVLSCKHTYHPECINQWLQINKVCPVCSIEVSSSENKVD